MRKQSPTLEQLQVGKLQEIGHYLQQHRQEQGLSLKDVTERTRIPLRTLRAIEAAQLTQLPEPIYVQGFIRRFADALGFDGTALAKDFPTQIVSQRSPQTTWRRLPAAQLRPLHLYWLYIAVIVFAINSLSSVVRRSADPRNLTLQETLVGPEFPEVSLVEEPSSPPLPHITPAVQVNLTFQAESWIRVTADGSTIFEGILPAGTERRWAAQEQIVIRAGNAGGVLLALNDNSTQPLGPLGAVKEVVYRASENTTPSPD